MFIFIKFKLIQSFFSPLLQRQIILSNPFKSSRADYLAGLEWDFRFSFITIVIVTPSGLGSYTSQNREIEGLLRLQTFCVKVDQQLLLLLRPISLTRFQAIIDEWIHNHFCLILTTGISIQDFLSGNPQVLQLKTPWLCLIWQGYP